MVRLIQLAVCLKAGYCLGSTAVPKWSVSFSWRSVSRLAIAWLILRRLNGPPHSVGGCLKAGYCLVSTAAPKWSASFSWRSVSRLAIAWLVLRRLSGPPHSVGGLSQGWLLPG